MTDAPKGPHQDLTIATGGTPLEQANIAMLMLHGRGATAQSMIALAGEFAEPQVAYRALQANGRTWYPQSFMAPIEQNEPNLSSALAALDREIDRLESVGMAPDRTLLLGFSQGACLALEYAARNPRRYAGIIGFSGGLIGPEDTDFDYDGSLGRTPVFLGCSDQDPHIPLERVQETAAVLKEMGGSVTSRIYEGMGHTVNDDEIKFVRNLLERLVRKFGPVRVEEVEQDALDDFDDDEDEDGYEEGYIDEDNEDFAGYDEDDQ